MIATIALEENDRRISITNQSQRNDTNNESIKHQSSFNIYKSLEEKARLLKQNKKGFCDKILIKINPFSGMSATRKTICALISIPFFCMLIVCILSFMLILEQTNQILDQYIDNLYQGKQEHSKRQNNAILIQLNSELQNIAWSSYCIDKFQRKLLFLEEKYFSIDFSVDAYNIQETLQDKQTLDSIIDYMKTKSPFLSFWQNKDYNDNKVITDDIKFFVFYQSIVNLFVRPVLYNSYKMNKQYARKVLIQDIFFGAEYDGSFFSNFLSSAYEEVNQNENIQYTKSDTCEYVYFQAQDIRTFEWFTKSIQTKYLNVIQPKVYKDPCSNPFKASLICLRSTTYYSVSKKPFSVMCNSFLIDQLADYFSEYSLYSDFSLAVDPVSLKVVFHSQSQDNSSFKIKYLKEYDFFVDDQDPKNPSEQKYSLIDQIIEYFKQINNQFTEQIDLVTSFDTSKSQKVIQHFKNGKQYEVIVNAAKIFSKLNYIDEPKGYQQVNLFMFLDVLSKDTLISEGVKLKSKVEIIEIIQLSCYLFFMIVFILRVSKHAMEKSNLIDIPVSRLTELLRTIQFQSLFFQSRDLPNGFDIIDIEALNEIDESFQSYETKILFESFQNLFNMLRFTTQELYQQNDGMALLNLCNQVKHFEKFKNIRALGICHNNVGNIHFNNQRYVESLQEYQRAIIYSQYELKCYSSLSENFGTEGPNYTQKNSSLGNSKKTNKEQLQAEILQVLNNENQVNEQKDLHWNLFNRKFNFLKCFIMYIQTSYPQNQCFWEDALTIIDEMYEISQNCLVESHSRVVLLNYFKHMILSKIGKDQTEQQQNVISMSNQEIIQQILNYYNKEEEEDVNPYISLKSNQLLANNGHKKSPLLYKNKSSSPTKRKGKKKNTLTSNFLLSPNDINHIKNGSLNGREENRITSIHNKTETLQNRQRISNISGFLSQFSQNHHQSSNQIRNYSSLQQQVLHSDERSLNTQNQQSNTFTNTQRKYTVEDFLGIQLLERLAITYKQFKDQSLTSLKTLRQISGRNQEIHEIHQNVFNGQKKEASDSLNVILTEGNEAPPLAPRNIDLQLTNQISFQNQQILTTNLLNPVNDNINSNQIENSGSEQSSTMRRYLSKQINDPRYETEQPFQLDFISEADQPISPIMTTGQNPLLMNQKSSDRSNNEKDNSSEFQDDQFKMQTPQQSPILKINNKSLPNIFLSPPSSLKMAPMKQVSEINYFPYENKNDHLKSFSNIHNLSPEKEKDYKDHLASFSLNNFNFQQTKSIQGRSKNDTFYQSAYFVQPEQQTIQQNTHFQNNQIGSSNCLNKNQEGSDNQIHRNNTNDMFTLPTRDQITTAKVSPEGGQIKALNYPQLNEAIKNINEDQTLNQKSHLNLNGTNNNPIFHPLNQQNYSTSRKRDDGSKFTNNSKMRQLFSPPFLKIGSSRDGIFNSRNPGQSLSKEDIAKYEFPPDILCQHVLDMDTDILLKEQKLFLAAKILTTCLEQSQTFYSQLKFSILCKIRNIFKHSNITSIDLENMINNFNRNIAYKIQFVSCCTSDQGKFESISIVQGLIDSIITKNDDQFGFIDYKEPLFEQVITFMSKQRLEKSKRIINSIIDSLQPPEVVAYQLELQNEIEQQIDEQLHSNLGSFLHNPQQEQNEVVRNKIGKQNKNGEKNNKKDSKYPPGGEIKNNFLDVNNTFSHNSNNKALNLSIQAKSNCSHSNNNSFIEQRQNQPDKIDKKNNEISQPEDKSPYLKRIQRRNSRKKTTRKYTLAIEGTEQNTFVRSSKRIPTLVRSSSQLNSQQNNSEASEKLINLPNTIPNSNNDCYQSSQNLIMTINSTQNILIPTNSFQKRSSFCISQQPLKLASTFQRSSFYARAETEPIDSYSSQQQQSCGIESRPKLFKKMMLDESSDQDQIFEFGKSKFKKFQKQSHKEQDHQEYDFLSNLQFHLGIRKALLTFQDLNFQKHQTNQTQYQYNPYGSLTQIDLINDKQDKFTPPFQFQSSIQKKFIIFSTDMPGIMKNQLFDSLKKILYKSNIKLLVLLLNESDSIEEHNQLTDQFFENVCVIKIFFEGEKLLQYLFNQRETSNIHLFPLIVEHY